MGTGGLPKQHSRFTRQKPTSVASGYKNRTTARGFDVCRSMNLFSKGKYVTYCTVIDTSIYSAMSPCKNGKSSKAEKATQKLYKSEVKVDVDKT
jgi:hypothetical protein